MLQASSVRVFAGYNRWMNEKVYAASARLSDAQRKEDRGAFFKSIHGTLNHLLWADGVWLGRFDGNSYPSGPFGEIMYPDFERMWRERQHLDGAIEHWAANVDDEWLAGTLTWTGKLQPTTYSQPRWFAVLHMFNHQTHHRGQTTTLLTQFGQDVGDTDLLKLPQGVALAGAP